MGPLTRLLAATALVLAFAPTAAVAGVPEDFVGLTSEDVFAGDASYRTSNLSAQTAVGAGLLRQTFDWSQIERSRGQYDLSYYDDYVAAAAAHGVRILPILFRPPPFRSRAPARGARPGTYPPRDYGELGRFGAVLVRRYGPRGTLWSERPEIPYLPIRAWQIWNEPNLRAYWPTGPNARQYARLLALAGREIKRADRRAEIVTAGMPQSRLGVPLARYLTALYRAGARSAFDTLGINTYARSERDLERTLRSVRRIMDRFRDRRARIWITEIGWSDRGPRSPFRAGLRGQGTRITRSFAVIARLRRTLRLRGVVYYSWRDSPPYAPHFRDFWGLHTGLLNREGEPKPAFYSFRRAVGRLR